MNQKPRATSFTQVACVVRSWRDEGHPEHIADALFLEAAAVGTSLVQLGIGGDWQPHAASEHVGGALGKLPKSISKGPRTTQHGDIERNAILKSLIQRYQHQRLERSLLAAAKSFSRWTDSHQHVAGGHDSFRTPLKSRPAERRMVCCRAKP